MSHIHIPDGVLPTLAVARRLARRARARVRRWPWSERSEVRRKVPLLAVVSALMLVAIRARSCHSLTIVNLTVIAGVLLGPVLSIIAHSSSKSCSRCWGTVG